MKKTLLFLGSSVTYGMDVDNYSMCEYLAATDRFEVIKWAVPGTTLADIDSQSYVSRLAARRGEVRACDHFICQLSTNDAGRGLPLGEISPYRDPADFDTATVTGAMEWIIATAKATWHAPVAFYTGTRFDNSRYAVMVERLFALQKKWDIGIIDLWNDPDMNAVTPDEYARYMGDPIHPTKVGYDAWWGPKFLAYLAK